MGAKLTCKHPNLEKYNVRGPRRLEGAAPKQYAYFQCPDCKLQAYRKRDIDPDGFKTNWLGWETEAESDEEEI